MGFFDFIFRGPELSRFDALNICEKIATKLFKEELTIEIFVRDFDQILERYFRLYYPDCSIKPEQSKQIFEYSIYIYENHEDWFHFDWRVLRRYHYRKGKINIPLPDLPNKDALYLFKDKPPTPIKLIR
mgnify:CR=1 FL=1